MISTRHRFIFLHVPKTAGNAVQSQLLPHSDDRMVARGTQDGNQRFGIEGEVTPHKHATLQDYAEALGDALAEYRIILTIRPPFERMVSLYLSPRRWHQQVPHWNRADFLTLTAKSPSTAAFLHCGGSCALPDYLLRFDSLEMDFRAVWAALGLPMTAEPLPVRNRSEAPTGLAKAILQDRDLRALVENAFADDMALLRATRPPGAAKGRVRSE